MFTSAMIRTEQIYSIYNAPKVTIHNIQMKPNDLLHTGVRKCVSVWLYCVTMWVYVYACVYAYAYASASRLYINIQTIFSNEPSFSKLYSNLLNKPVNNEPSSDYICMGFDMKQTKLCVNVNVWIITHQSAGRIVRYQRFSAAFRDEFTLTKEVGIFIVSFFSFHFSFLL